MKTPEIFQSRNDWLRNRRRFSWLCDNQNKPRSNYCLLSIQVTPTSSAFAHRRGNTLPYIYMRSGILDKRYGTVADNIHQWRCDKFIMPGAKITREAWMHQYRHFGIIGSYLPLMKCYTAMQSQHAVSAYFTSKPILLCDFVQSSIKR